MLPDYGGFAAPAFLEFSLVVLPLSALAGSIAFLALKLRLRALVIASGALLGASGALISGAVADAAWHRFSQGDPQLFDGLVELGAAIVVPILWALYRSRRAASRR